MSVSTSTRLRNVVSTIPNPFPYPVSVAGKFLLCGTVGQFTWLLFVDSINGGGTASTSDVVAVSSMSLEEMLFFGVLTLPSLVVAAVYTTLPTESVDWYHRFGKGSALFFALNVSLSGSLVAWSAVYDQMPVKAIEMMGVWVLASLFLPGIYIGCLVATRWAR